MNIMEDSSTIVAGKIQERYPLEWAKYTMYHDDNKYNMIPRLYFRLEDSTKYDELKECIEMFSGTLNWTLYRYAFSRKDNHVIAPKILFDIKSDQLEKDVHIAEKDIFTDEQYKKICDEAIGDIPKLAEHIKNWNHQG